MLFLNYESIAPDTYSASRVRRWRLLLWRSRLRRRRDWPDSGDMPYHLFHGRIPYEKLTGYRLPDFEVAAQSMSRYGLLRLFHWSAQNNLVCEQRNQFPDIGVILVSSIRQFTLFCLFSCLLLFFDHDFAGFVPLL